MLCECFFERSLIDFSIHVVNETSIGNIAELA